MKPWIRTFFSCFLAVLVGLTGMSALQLKQSASTTFTADEMSVHQSPIDIEWHSIAEFSGVTKLLLSMEPTEESEETDSEEKQSRKCISGSFSKFTLIHYGNLNEIILSTNQPCHFAATSPALFLLLEVLII